MMRFMLISLFLIGSAIAQTNRDLGDLMWIPYEKVRYGQTAYEFEGSQVNIDGDDLERDVMKQNFTQTVGYGFSNDLSLVFKYLHQSKGKTSLTPGQVRSDELGAKNPRLGLIWRLKEQSADSSAFDLSLIASPNYLDREVDENDTDVDAAEGGYTANLGLEWGQKTDKRQWSAEVNLLWEGDTETVYENNDMITRDARLTIETAYNWQAYMLPFLDFRSRISLGRTTAYAIDNDFDNTETDVDAVWRGQLGGTLVWSPWRNLFVINTGVTVFRDHDYEVEVDDNTAEYKDSKGYIIHLSALYTF